MEPGKPATSEKGGSKGSRRASSSEMSLHGSFQRQGKVGASGAITPLWNKMIPHIALSKLLLGKKRLCKATYEKWRMTERILK